MIVANASTDVTTYFVLRDSTNHAPATGITITDIDLYYVESGAAISAKADATALAAADSAHSDNTAFHVGQGLYRIDWPDAAFDGGVGKHVILIVVCSGVDTTYLEIELSPAVNAVALGGTAQTGRDIGASVLLSSGTGTGQISLSSGTVTVGTNNDKTGYTASTVSDKTGYALTSAYDAAKTAASQTSVDTVAGYLDTEVAAIKAKTDNLPSDPADQSAVEAAITAATSGLATASALSTVAGYVDTEVAAIKVVTDKLDTAVELDGSVYRLTANALELAPTGGSAPSAADIADAVWDEALAGHTSAGSAGKVVGDNLNATVSSRLASADYTAPANGDITSIKAKTDNLPASPAAVGSAMTLANDALTAAALAADAVTEIQSGLATSAEITALNDVAADDVADAVLARDLGSGTAAGTSEERTVRSALRILRNKWSISGTTLTVTKEDDTTAAWTAEVSTDAAAEPIVGANPT
jgi:hypothetical protein